MGLSDFETDSIKGLQVKKGVFSEVFYIQENRKAILRIIPDKISYWLCTSDAKDKSIIEDLRKKNSSLNLMDLISFLTKGRKL